MEKDINKLKTSDLVGKLDILQKLIKDAKKNVDNSNAVDVLIEIISEDNEEIWNAAADALTYYFKNYISFYCKNFKDFPRGLKELKNSNGEIRHRVAYYLSTHKLFTKKVGRKWKFMEDSEIQKLINGLNSSSVEERFETAQAVLSKVNDSYEIHKLVPSLHNALHDKDRGVRWMIAEVLGDYIIKYMYKSYDYQLEGIRNLKNSDIEKRRELAEGYTQYAYGEDQDERDMSLAIPSLIVCLYEEDSLLKGAALKSLDYAQHEHDISYALPAIKQILEDENLSNLHELASSIIENEKKPKRVPYYID